MQSGEEIGMALRILAVDDETKVLYLFKILVEQSGFEVLGLTDSREAAQVIDHQRFDGIFLDVQMPHLDGFELTQRVRDSALNGLTPVIMLSILDDVETMRRAYRTGITLFVGKPFDKEKLCGLLGAWHGGVPQEQRRSARLPLRFLVDCRSAENHFASETLDISEDGMSLSPSGGASEGQEMEIRFQIPRAPEPSRLGARVVRLQSSDGIGVEFIGLEQKDRYALQSLIAGWHVAGGLGDPLTPGRC
jgi:CheY-like chemotaxis protein